MWKTNRLQVLADMASSNLTHYLTHYGFYAISGVHCAQVFMLPRKKIMEHEVQ